MAVEDYLLKFRLDVEPALRVIDRLNTATTTLHSNLGKIKIEPKLVFTKVQIKQSFDNAIRGMNFRIPAEVVVNFTPTVDTSKLEKQIVSKLSKMKEATRGKSAGAEKVMIQVSLANGASQVKKEIEKLTKSTTLKITPTINQTQKNIIQNFIKSSTGTRNLTIQAVDSRGTLDRIVKKVNAIPRTVSIYLVPETSEADHALQGMKDKFAHVLMTPKIAEKSPELKKLQDFVTQNHALKLKVDKSALTDGKGSYAETIRVVAEKALRSAFGQMQRDKKGIEIPVAKLEVEKATLKNIEATKTAINTLSRQISDNIKLKVNEMQVNVVIKTKKSGGGGEDGGDSSGGSTTRRPTPVPQTPNVTQVRQPARPRTRSAKAKESVIDEVVDEAPIPVPTKKPRASKAKVPNVQDVMAAEDRVEASRAAAKAQLHKTRLIKSFNDEVSRSFARNPSSEELREKMGVRGSLTGVCGAPHFADLFGEKSGPGDKTRAAVERARAVEAARKELSDSYGRLKVGTGKTQEPFHEKVVKHFSPRLIGAGVKGIDSGSIDKKEIGGVSKELEEFSSSLGSTSLKYALASSDKDKEKIIKEAADAKTGVLGKIGIKDKDDVANVVGQYAKVSKKHLSKYKLDSEGYVAGGDPYTKLISGQRVDPNSIQKAMFAYEQVGGGQPGLVNTGGILGDVFKQGIMAKLPDMEEALGGIGAREMSTGGKSKFMGKATAGKVASAYSSNLFGAGFRDPKSSKTIKEMMKKVGTRVPKVNEFNPDYMEHDPVLKMFAHDYKKQFEEGATQGISIPNKNITGFLGNKVSKIDLGSYANEVFVSPEAFSGKNPAFSESVVNHELLHGLYSSFGQYMNAETVKGPHEKNKAFTKMPSPASLFNITKGLKSAKGGFYHPADAKKHKVSIDKESISRSQAFLGSFGAAPIKSIKEIEKSLLGVVPSNLKSLLPSKRMDNLFESLHEGVVSAAGLATTAPSIQSKIKSRQIKPDAMMETPFGPMSAKEIVKFSRPLLSGVKDPLSLSGQGQIMKNLQVEASKIGKKGENKNFSKFFSTFDMAGTFSKSLTIPQQGELGKDLTAQKTDFDSFLGMLDASKAPLVGTMAGGYAAKFDLMDVELQRRNLRNRAMRGRKPDPFYPLSRAVNDAQVSPLIQMRGIGKRGMAVDESLSSNRGYDESVFGDKRMGQPISSANIRNLDQLIVKYRALAEALVKVSGQTKAFVLEMAKSSPIIEDAISRVEKSTGKSRSKLTKNELLGSLSDLGSSAQAQAKALAAARKESYHDIRRRGVETITGKVNKGLMPEQHELLQAFTGKTVSQASKLIEKGKMGRDSLSGYILEHGITPKRLAHIAEARMEFQSKGEISGAIRRGKESPDVAKTLEAVAKISGQEISKITPTKMKESLAILEKKSKEAGSEYSGIKSFIPRYDLRTKIGMSEAMGYLSEEKRGDSVYGTDKGGKKVFRGYDSDETFYEKQLSREREKLQQQMRMAAATGQGGSYRTRVNSRQGAPVIDETVLIGKQGQITGTINEGLKKGVLSIHGINGELNQAIHKVANWALATGAVYGMLSAFKGAQEVIVSFNREITNLTAILSPSKEQLEELSSAALKIGASYGQDIKGVVSAMTEFSRQGLKQKEIIDATEASMLLANVSMLDAKDASKAMMTVLKQMQIPFEDAVGVIDKLTSVDAAFAVTLDDLTKGLGRTGRAAVTFGMDLDHIIAVIGTVGEATQRSGKEIGTAFRTAFARGVSGQTIKLFESIGIQMRDAKGNVASFQEIIDKIGGSWKKYSEVQKLAIAEGLGGKMRLNEMLSLFDNYDRYLQAVVISENSSGNARKRNEVIMASLAKQIQVTRSSIEGLVVALGDKGLLHILSMVQVTMQGVTAGLTAMDSVTGGLVSTILSATLLFGGGVGSLGMVANSLGFYGVPRNVPKPKIDQSTGQILSSTTSGASPSSALANSLATGTSTGATTSVLSRHGGRVSANAAVAAASSGAFVSGEKVFIPGVEKAAAGAAAGAAGKSASSAAAGSIAGSIAGSAFAGAFGQKLSAIGQMIKGGGILGAKIAVVVGVAVVALTALSKTWKYLNSTSEELADAQRKLANREKEKQDSVRELALSTTGLGIDPSSGLVSGKSMTNRQMEETMQRALADERLRSMVAPINTGQHIRMTFRGAMDSSSLAERMNKTLKDSENKRIKNILKEIEQFGVDGSAGILNSRFAFRSAKSGLEYSNDPLRKNPSGGNVGGAEFSSGYARQALQQLVDGNLNSYQKTLRDFIEPQLRRANENFSMMSNPSKFSITGFVSGDSNNLEKLTKSLEIVGNLVSSKEGYVGLKSPEESVSIGSKYLARNAFQSRGVNIYDDVNYTSKNPFTKITEEYVKRDNGEVVDFTKNLTVAFGKLKEEQSGNVKSLTKISELSKIVSKDSIILKHGLDDQSESILHVRDAQGDLIEVYNSSTGVIERLTEQDLPNLSIATDRVTSSMGNSLTTIDQLKAAIEAVGNTITTYKRISDTVSFGFDGDVASVSDRKKVLGFDTGSTYNERLEANRGRDASVNEMAMLGRVSGFGINEYSDAIRTISDVMVSGKIQNSNAGKVSGIDLSGVDLGGGLEKQANAMASLYEQVKSGKIQKTDPEIKAAIVEALKSAYGYQKVGEQLKQQAYVRGDEKLYQTIDTVVTSGNKSLLANMKFLSDMAGIGNEQNLFEDGGEGGGKKYKESLISDEQEGTIGYSLSRAGMGNKFFEQSGLEDIFSYYSKEKPLDDAVSIAESRGRSAIRTSSNLPDEIIGTMAGARKDSLDKLLDMNKTTYESSKKLREYAVSEMRESVEEAQRLSEFGANIYDKSEKGISKQTGGTYSTQTTSPIMLLTRDINASLKNQFEQNRLTGQMARDFILAAEAGLKFNSVLRQVARGFLEGASQGLTYGGKYSSSNVAQQAQIQLSGFQKLLQASTEDIMKAEERVKSAGGEISGGKITKSSGNEQLDKEFNDGIESRAKIEESLFSNYATGSGQKKGVLSLLLEEDLKKLEREKINFPAAGGAVNSLANSLESSIQGFVKTGDYDKLQSDARQYEVLKKSRSGEIGGFQSQALAGGEAFRESLIANRPGGPLAQLSERNKQLGFNTYEQFKTNLLTSGAINTSIIRAGQIITDATTNSGGSLEVLAETVFSQLKAQNISERDATAILKIDDKQLKEYMNHAAKGIPYSTFGQKYEYDKTEINTVTQDSLNEASDRQMGSSKIKELIEAITEYSHNRKSLLTGEFGSLDEVLTGEFSSFDEAGEKRVQIEEAKAKAFELISGLKETYKDNPVILDQLNSSQETLNSMPLDIVPPGFIEALKKSTLYNDWYPHSEIEKEHLKNLTAISSKLLELLNGVQQESKDVAPVVPTMHSGGLASDEFPAILQRGEAVIPKNMVSQIPSEVLSKLPRYHSGAAPDSKSYTSAKNIAEDPELLLEFLEQNPHIKISDREISALLKSIKEYSENITKYARFASRFSELTGLNSDRIQKNFDIKNFDIRDMDRISVDPSKGNDVNHVQNGAAFYHQQLYRQHQETLSKAAEISRSINFQRSMSDRDKMVKDINDKYVASYMPRGPYKWEDVQQDSSPKPVAAQIPQSTIPATSQAISTQEHALNLFMNSQVGKGRENLIGQKVYFAGFVPVQDSKLGTVKANVSAFINKPDDSGNISGFLQWQDSSGQYVKYPILENIDELQDRKQRKVEVATSGARFEEARRRDAAIAASAAATKSADEAKNEDRINAKVAIMRYQAPSVASPELGGSNSWSKNMNGYSYGQYQERFRREMALERANRRMHSGGLASDEFPAILQRGEAVIPRSLVPKIPKEVMSQLPKYHSGADLSFLEARRTVGNTGEVRGDSLAGINEDIKRVADLVEKFFATFKDQQTNVNTSDSLSTAVDMLAQIAAKIEDQSTNSALEQSIMALVELIGSQNKASNMTGAESMSEETGNKIEVEVHHKGLPEERTVRIVVDKFDENALQQIVANLVTDPNFVNMLMGAMNNKPIGGA